MKAVQAATMAKMDAAKELAEAKMAAEKAARQAEEARKAAEEASAKAKIKVTQVRGCIIAKFQLMSRLEFQVVCHETQTDVNTLKHGQEEELRPVAPSFIESLVDIVLLEGENCQLKAKVTGVPLPKITWYDFSKSAYH